MRKVTVGVMFALIILLVSGFSFAVDHPDAWVIGVHDGATTKAFMGALEYPSVDQATYFEFGTPTQGEQLANGWAYLTFDYTVTGPTDDNPIIPGYLGSQNVCAFNSSGDRPCTISTALLNIHFNLTCDYEAGELAFILSRYGSEEGDVLIDGTPTGPPVGAVSEGNHADLAFDLAATVPGGVLTAGPHTITLSYLLNGAENGHYIDELDLIPLKDSCVVDEGRMTGGGSVIKERGSRITHGFELHCDPEEGPNNLEVNWRGRQWGNGSSRFHLESLETAECLDTVLEEGPPVAGFDTYIGSGMGRYNGESGYSIQWVFTDDGQPGRRDTATILITAPDGTVVLDVDGHLQQGNHQAH